MAFFGLFNGSKAAIARYLSKVPLRVTITVPFLVQTLTVVGIVGYISYRTGQKAVRDVVEQLQDEVAGRVEQKLQSYLELPYRINQLSAGAVEQGYFQLDFAGNIDSQTRFLTQQMQAFPEMSWIYCGDTANSAFLGVEKAEIVGQFNVAIANAETNFKSTFYALDSRGDRLSSIPWKTETATYILGDRNWYQEAVAAGKPIWVKDIYADVNSKYRYLTASHPIYDAQTQALKGVCNVDITLSDFDDFLRNNLAASTAKKLLIINRDGKLIANSTDKPSTTFVEGADGKPESLLLGIEQFDDEVVAYTSQYLDEVSPNWRQTQQSQSRKVRYQNKDYWVKVLPFQNEQGLDWLILILVPESEFMAEITASVQQNAIICFVAIAGTLVLGFLTASWVILPLKNFTKSVRAITLGDWQQSLPEKDRVDEIGALAQSVELMASQLEISFSSLEEHNQELQRLDRLKDEFLSNTSHELRTPLNGIIGIAESLLDGATGPLTTQTRQNLAMIVSSGRRLGSLVDDLLDFFKLKHTELELQRSPIALRALVELVLMLSRPLVKHSLIEFENNVPEDLPPVHADENRLLQIFHNLVGNAIKFTDKGSISIEAKQQDQNIVIEVIDTGIGIAVAEQARIFESFEQADGSSSRQYSGTGLGLAITKKLIELHGGAIAVESTPKEGSTFRFTLPISLDQAQSTSPQPALGELQQSFVMRRLTGDPEPTSFLDPQTLRADHPERYSILLVDDEPVNLQVLVNHLSLQDYAIAQASNGLEALEFIESGIKPDIVLLDIMMPRMTGYEVCRQLREKYSLDELPVVMLTAKNQVSDLVTGFDCGANDYLTKPISKAELLARIKTHLQLSSISVKNAQLYFQLGESEIRLRHFLEAMPVGVVIVRPQGKPYYLNRLATQMLQKGVVESVTISNIAETYHLYKAGTDDYYTSMNLSLIQALLGNSSGTDDIEIRREDGVVIPIESWGTPVKNEDGEVEFAIVAFQDIRQRRQTEAEREEYIQKLSDLNTSLRRFLPKEFLQILGKTSIEEVELGNQIQRDMTILFADIRNFTSISERMQAQGVFALLNDYLGRMEPLIEQHSGFIDKYIGDGIMALFPHSPQDAVQAAIAMLKALERQTITLYPELHIGIGIHTGESLLGTVGGYNRLETTVIGDTVNIASRIESLTKFYGVRLLITEETYACCERLTVREIDRVTLKGRSRLTTIYEVLLDSDRKKREHLLLFREAIAAYYSEDYEQSLRLFLELRRLNPDDTVAKVHGDRLAQQLKQNLRKRLGG